MVGLRRFAGPVDWPPRADVRLNDRGTPTTENLVDSKYFCWIPILPEHLAHTTLKTRRRSPRTSYPRGGDFRYFNVKSAFVFVVVVVFVDFPIFTRFRRVPVPDTNRQNERCRTQSDRRFTTIYICSRDRCTQM